MISSINTGENIMSSSKKLNLKDMLTKKRVKTNKFYDFIDKTKAYYDVHVVAIDGITTVYGEKTCITLEILENKTNKFVSLVTQDKALIEILGLAMEKDIAINLSYDPEAKRWNVE